MPTTTEPLPPHGTPEYWLWQADRNIDRACETGDGTYMWQAIMQIRTALRTHLREERTPSAPPAAIAVGELVRRARREAGLTQAELGSRLPAGVSHAAISDIERGKTAPTLRALDDLATALGLPLLVDITIGDRAYRVRP
jgi:ribosome-binding protein aMBF1 (putative translation factor)